MQMEGVTDVNLGVALLEKKLITEHELKEALDQQKLRGGFLSQRLIELGYVEDTDITTCLTCQYGFCYLPISSYSVSENTLKIIPPQFIRAFCVLPIERNDRLLTVAMADPLNKGVIEILRQVTRCEIVVFVSGRGELKETIESYLGEPLNEFALDGFCNEMTLRDDLQEKFISNGLYTGPNRRRYKRLYRNLSGQYFIYPDIFKAKIKNIGMGGLLLETNTLIPIGTQMAINVFLTNSTFIAGVVEVAWVEAKSMIDTESGNSQTKYDIGTFLSFLSEENQQMLSSFLKEGFRS